MTAQSEWYTEGGVYAYEKGQHLRLTASDRIYKVTGYRHVQPEGDQYVLEPTDSFGYDTLPKGYVERPGNAELVESPAPVSTPAESHPAP